MKVNEEEVHISSIDYDVILNRDLDAELFEAAASDNEAIALACIASGADVNKRNGRGWTPKGASTST